MKNKIELAEDFVDTIRNIVKYWKNLKVSEEEKLNGIAFNILVELDGGGCNHYDLKKLIWDDEKENVIGTTEVFNGYLHELYYKENDIK